MNERIQTISTTLRRQVLEPLKGSFVSKDEVIDLLGVTLVAGENLFILGPPGTAKSAIVRALSQLVGGKTFEYLLTRFTEPSELFGPFDIRKLKEGDLETNTEGMLPEASFAFLDELLNANSAILNSLLNVLHERVMRRGKEVRKLPLLCTVGASNHLPEDEALEALFDRFLLRVRCGYADESRLQEVLEAGWKLESKQQESQVAVSIEDLRWLNEQISTVNLQPIYSVLLDRIHRMREAGLPLSDRRAVKLQRIIASSALLCGRLEAQVSDLWVLRHVWDNEEQIEMLQALVDEVVSKEEEEEHSHPGSRHDGTPDPDVVSSLLDGFESQLDNLTEVEDSESAIAVMKDQLSSLSARIEWINNETSREHLKVRIDNIWNRIAV